MLLKCGKREFEVDKTDEILDNGCSYQLITQTYYMDWARLHPRVSKATFNRLLKEEKIYKDRKFKPCHYLGENEMWIYKFYED